MIAGKYYCNAILHAYANNVPIKQADMLEYRTRHLVADYHGKDIVKLAIKKGVKGEYERFFAYLDKHDISNYLYLDYIRACNFLNLDCHDDKIRYPKDFHRWHDITRTQECGIRREIVSLWAGHKADSSITTTVYTHFQERSELQLQEIEKYKYNY